MNDRIDKRKVSKYLYELSGRAGTICVSAQPHEPGTQPNPERLARSYYEPEYNEAMRLWLTLSDRELESRLESTPENIIHPCGSPLQWGPYLQMNERGYEEYLKSDEWKRKRDMVMQRAMQSFMPARPDIRYTVDKYGRVITWIANVEHRPTCANDGCTNEATDVHHLTYERLGKERLDDLQALCRKCHEQKHK